MPATMLMGLTEHGAELAGYGPIPAQVARELAADGTWRRLLTDPVSGHLLDYGRTTYRPPAALADFIRARDHHCVFPGCRHHHRLKHEGGWTLEHRNGRHIWTTPDGQQYIREPEPIAEPQPPPQPQLQPERHNANDEPPPF